VWIVVRRIGMLLITIFVELRAVAERGQVTHRPSLDGRGLEKNGMVRAWQGRGMDMAWQV
jgi:hypothetical protein